MMGVGCLRRVNGVSGLLEVDLNDVCRLLEVGLNGVYELLEVGLNGVSELLEVGLNGVSELLEVGLNDVCGLLEAGLNDECGLLFFNQFFCLLINFFSFVLLLFTITLIIISIIYLFYLFITFFVDLSYRLKLSSNIFPALFLPERQQRNAKQTRKIKTCFCFLSSEQAQTKQTNTHDQKTRTAFSSAQAGLRQSQSRKAVSPGTTISLTGSNKTGLTQAASAQQTPACS